MPAAGLPNCHRDRLCHHVPDPCAPTRVRDRPVPGEASKGWHDHHQISATQRHLALVDVNAHGCLGRPDSFRDPGLRPPRTPGEFRAPRGQAP